MNEPPTPSPPSPTPGFQFSLGTMMILLTVTIVVFGGCYELFRLRTVAHYVEYRLYMHTRESYAPEQPVDLIFQDRYNAFPKINAHFNSAACLERMRAEFSDFDVSQVWRTENVEFTIEGAGFVPCPMWVYCELPVPGYDKRDVMKSVGSSGVDRALLPEFKARWERFVVRELEDFCAQQEQAEAAIQTTAPAPDG